MTLYSKSNPVWRKTSGQFGQVDVLFINRLVAGSITPTEDKRFRLMIKHGLTDITTVHFSKRETCIQHLCAAHDIDLPSL